MAETTCIKVIGGKQSMLSTQWLQVKVGEKNYRFYTSRLEAVKTPLPVVIVIQEIWGTDAHILDVVDRFAKAGYLAVAPDLYAEDGERPAILKEDRIEKVKAFLSKLPPTSWHDEDKRLEAIETLPEKEREEIAPTFHDLFLGLKRLPERLETLKATMNFLEDYEFSRGQKVASIGFCMGGALSARLACLQPDLSAAVIFYGNLPDKDQMQGINCPVLGFFGGLDERITSQVEGFVANMKGAQKDFDYRIYEGAKHAFFNDTRPAYHSDAARDSWARTINFFNKTLR
jgi:carboxymethylenebutenolidase